MSQQLVLSNPDATLPRWLFEDSGGGIAVSGAKGSGKSVFLRELLLSAIRSCDTAVFLIDPHGDLAKQLFVDCANMTESVHRRVYYAAPGDKRVPLLPLNPLAVERTDDMDAFEFEARLEYRVRHAAHLLISAWGHENFDAMPQLYKWTTIVLRTLSHLGLSIADALHFFDVGSPLYETLIQAVPNLMDRMEFEALGDMRTAEREQFIASTKNRFRGITSDPLLAAHLGVPDQAVNTRRLIEERAIVLLDFEGLGVLHDESKSILANFWLSEVFDAVMSAPRDRRLPCLICCDELPVFRHSRALLSALLPQIRKMKARFVGGFQGATSFHPDKVEDELFQSMIHMCGTLFCFQHKWRDALTFAEILSLPSYDGKRIKHEHWDKEQYHGGLEIMELIDKSYSDASGSSGGETFNYGVTRNLTSSRSVTTGESEETSHARADGTQDHWSTGTTEGEAVQRDRDLVQQAFTDTVSQRDQHGGGKSSTETLSTGQSRSRSEALAESRGESHEEGHGSSSQWSKQHSEGVSVKQQMVPIMEWRDVLRSITFYTPEEQKMEFGKEIAGLDKGEAFLQHANHEAVRVRVNMTPDPYTDTPQARERETSQLLAQVTGRGMYHDRVGILEKRRERIASVAQEITRLLEQPVAIESSCETLGGDNEHFGI